MQEVAKVLLIGIDAGDKDLLERWSQEGRLPTLRALMQQGLRGITQSPRGLFVGAIWPTFHTSLSPGRHGLYSWRQLKPGTYENYFALPTAGRHMTPFWHHLSDAGRRVAVLDAPHSYPHPNLNGIQVVEWGAHDPGFSFSTWPPELAQEVLARFGKHPLDGRCDGRRTAAEFEKFTKDIVRGIELKTQMSLSFLRQEPWDFFATIYGESHCVGHQCWHIHDPNHPRHDPEVLKKIGDPILAAYQAIDAGIGTILKEAGPETLTIVFASHGMGPHYDGTNLLDGILLRLEQSYRRQERRSSPLARWPELTTRIGRKLARIVRGAKIRTASGEVHSPDQPTRKQPATRQFFQVPNNTVEGAVRINLVGREPAGKVKPGHEYEAVCLRLEHDLREVVDLETGQPAIRDVYTIADRYPGPAAGHLPDLIVEWETTKPLRAVYSPAIGRMDYQYKGNRTGDHRPEGMFIAVGPGIEPRLLDRRIPVTHFGPTIATLLGVTLPETDGEPIAELVAPANAAVQSASLAAL